MVGAHQNLNGSRDLSLTTPLSGMICHPLGLATINLPTKFEVSISAQYEDMTSRSAEADKPARRAASRQNFKTVT